MCTWGLVSELFPPDSNPDPDNHARLGPDPEHDPDPYADPTIIKYNGMPAMLALVAVGGCYADGGQWPRW